MPSTKGEPLTDSEKKYLRRRQKKYDYTEDTEEKGKTPLSGRLKGEEFSKTLSQAMYELKGEIKGMRREIHANKSRIVSHEGSPSTSYHVCEHSATQPDPKRWSMPTFLSKKEGK